MRQTTHLLTFWHAILHLREPDAANSNYWWQLVGYRPVLTALQQDARELGLPDCTPERFVAACGRGGDDDVLRRVQLREWQLLFDHCWRATG